MTKNKVTIMDIASSTGFSKSTVSRVLSGDPHVSPNSKKIILEYAREMNYEPNYFAQGLKTNRSRTIAFFVPNIEIMIYPAIIQAMEAETRKLGYTILLCDIQEDKEIAMEYVQKLKSRNVDGFIFSTALYDIKKNAEIMEIVKSGVPCVNLLRDDGTTPASVHFDNAKGAEMGVEYLLGKGKRRIAFLLGQDYLQLYHDRFRGYVEALQRNGIKVDPDLVWYGYDGSERIATRVVSDRIRSGAEVDAIFCSSENLAIDTIHALSELGLKVPDDVSVLGYDNTPIAELFIPKITGIGQPVKEMGIKAVDVLVDMIENGIPEKKAEYVFDPYFIERDTVR